MQIRLSREFIGLRNQIFWFGILFFALHFLPLSGLGIVNGAKVDPSDKLPLEGALAFLVFTCTLAILPYLYRDLAQFDVSQIDLRQIVSAWSAGKPEPKLETPKIERHRIICTIITIVEAATPILFGGIVSCLGFSAMLRFAVRVYLCIFSKY